MQILSKDNCSSTSKINIAQILITLFGIVLTLLGGIFLLLPGPGLLLILIGLTLLSTQYRWAKRWLRLSQRQLSKSAAWLDDQMRNRFR